VCIDPNSGDIGLKSGTIADVENGLKPEMKPLCMPSADSAS